jgi:hypothetical protein
LIIGITDPSCSASYPGGGMGGPLIIYPEMDVPSGRVICSIEKYGLITSMRGVSVTIGSEAGVSIGIYWAYALLHELPPTLNISTVTTNKVNKTLYLAAAVFIFSPYNERL